ncbi:MAG TPA: DUF805 domain-containing protein [Jatrophihabitans sp.]|uniref:DUF805 domain-containing protein n=1 Tax=Jatrophihabitans sp. TaxID=1932789 RepID=UPI002DFB50A8|nr:DUF805 domain-containing protein [Jatrophihabitans sp.]
MTFAQAIRSGFSQYATFSGRARRSEFWWFSLFLGVVGVAASLIDVAAHGSIGTIVVTLATLLPSLAVSVRRLHDTGRSGGWLFIALIPLIGGIVLLVFDCQDSELSLNRWGYSPKYAS